MQYEEDGMLVDTFVLERKHKMLLSCGHDIGNTTRFERTVAVNSTIMQASILEKSKTSGLQDPVKPCLALSLLFGGAVEVSSSMRTGATFCWNTVLVNELCRWNTVQVRTMQRK